ncbi:MAG: hypothetical protein BAJALOKI1v1_2480001 [Promethearchaeota archaeon]|nr:MAG: hypothetical protein BAJALOKI1v1_2480001 [Candidatus Lokiarchaeota archaeon]
MSISFDFERCYLNNAIFYNLFTEEKNGKNKEKNLGGSDFYKVLDFEKYPKKAQKWRDRILTAFLRTVSCPNSRLETEVIILYLNFSKEIYNVVQPGVAPEYLSEEQLSRVKSILRREVNSQ